MKDRGRARWAKGEISMADYVAERIACKAIGEALRLLGRAA